MTTTKGSLSSLSVYSLITTKGSILNSRSIITKHTLKTVIDKNGNTILQDEWVQKNVKNKAKGGWRKIYMDMLSIYDCCVSNLENRMVRYIIEEIKFGFVLTMTSSKLAKHFNVSDKTAKKFLKKMKDIEFIRGVRGVYKTNPFMFIPYGTNDEAVNSAQIQWNNEDT